MLIFKLKGFLGCDTFRDAPPALKYVYIVATFKLIWGRFEGCFISTFLYNVASNESHDGLGHVCYSESFFLKIWSFYKRFINI